MSERGDGERVKRRVSESNARLSQLGASESERERESVSKREGEV